MSNTLGSDDIRDSAFYQQVFAEGKEAGETQGELKAKRASIREVLQARFGEQVAEPFAATLDELVSREVLRSLLRTAIRCANPDEFEAALPSP